VGEIRRVAVIPYQCSLGLCTRHGSRRSAVMPLDVLGRTRATLTEPASTSPWPKGLGNLVKLCRAGDRALQLLLFNEECLVSASHQLALITSLPFVTRGLETVKGATFNDAFQLREEHVAKCDCLPAATDSVRIVVHRLCEGRVKR
jgi:hypothetical protein